jgi:hypothetical protein
MRASVARRVKAVKGKVRCPLFPPEDQLKRIYAEEKSRADTEKLLKVPT